MKISFSAGVNSTIDLIIQPSFENKKGNKLFSGKSGETSFIPSSKIYHVGLGEKSKLESAGVRDCFANAMKKIMSEKFKKIAIKWDSSLNGYADEILQGILLVNYTIAKYKTGKDLKKEYEKLFTELVVVGGGFPKGFKQHADSVLKLVNAVHYVRDLVTGPPNIVTVDYMANEAKKIAGENKFTVKVLDKSMLQKIKMGALLSVNKGSSSKGAKMVVLEYKPKKATKKKPLLLVGKGLIFDSGGYNLKPMNYIENMQQDMAGGAVVFGVFKILKDINIDRPVIGIVPLTENMIDGEAQKPSDIITTYSGKTIEIRNTDAEGRLILSDALSYGIEKYKPEIAIDMATLTGACIIALGDRYAGVMGNDTKLTEMLIKSGIKTDELLWELPLHKDFTEAMKGQQADLRNIDNGTSHMAGASKAAAFLQNFIGETKWAHIDIAGTAYVQKPKAIETMLGTGYGVRLLVDFLKTV